MGANILDFNHEFSGDNSLHDVDGPPGVATDQPGVWAFGTPTTLEPGSGPHTDSNILVPGNGPCTSADTNTGISMEHSGLQNSLQDDDLRSFGGNLRDIGITDKFIVSGSRNELLSVHNFRNSFFQRFLDFKFEYSDVCVSGACWNSHGICGDLVFNDPTHASLKTEGFKRVLTSGHISAIQETHANAQEAQSISDQWNHSHHSWHSFGPERNSGGVATFIQKSWMSEALNAFSVEIFPGRVLLTVVIFPKMI